MLPTDTSHPFQQDLLRFGQFHPYALPDGVRDGLPALGMAVSCVSWTFSKLRVLRGSKLQTLRMSHCLRRTCLLICSWSSSAHLQNKCNMSLLVALAISYSYVSFLIVLHRFAYAQREVYRAMLM